MLRYNVTKIPGRCWQVNSSASPALLAGATASFTYGVYRVYSWRLIDSAHAEAKAICQVLLVKEKNIC
ncbi:MAG: hypothetical protein R2864_08940 [Syntrophotaleaceae bacterium]